MSAGRHPATRASSAKDSLSGLDKHRAGLTAKVRARIPEPTLAVIDSTARTGWIPVEHDSWIPRATLAELGTDEAIRYWRNFLPIHVQSPLLNAVVGGAVRLFGPSPASILRMTPRAWKLVFRDHCRLEISSEANTAHIVMHDVAPEVITGTGYEISFRAFFLGMLDVVKVDGDVEMEVDLKAARIEYTMHWS